MSELPAIEKRRKWLSPWRGMGLLLLVVIFIFVGRQLGKDFKELRAQNVSVSVNWMYLGASVVCLMGARLTNAVNTWLLLRALGARLQLGKVVAVIWMASLGRYIPGKVAVVAGAMAMLMRMGARFSVVGVALFLSTAMMILIGMVGAIPLFLSPRVMGQMPRGTTAVLVMAGVMGAVCLYPPIFLAICNVGLGMLKKERLPSTLRRGAFWGAIGIGLVRISCVSMSLWLAARAIAPLEARTVLLAMGTASLASVLGFLAVFAPAGLGVHEMVYLIALKPVVGPAVAVLVIMFRGMNVIMDLVVAGIGAGIMRRDGTTRTAAEAAPTGVIEHG